MKTLLPVLGLAGLLACGCGKKNSTTTTSHRPDDTPATVTANTNMYTTTYENELAAQLEMLEHGYFTGKMEDSDELYRKVHAHDYKETPLDATNYLSFSNFTNKTWHLFWNEKAQGQEPPPVEFVSSANLYSTTFENESQVQLMIAAFGYNYAQVQDNGEDFFKQSGHYSESPVINMHNMSLETLTNQFAQDFWVKKEKGQEPPPIQQ